MSEDEADGVRRMAEARPPLFLARRSYRRRRMTDACRMLPVLGAALWMLPILWQPAATEAGDTAFGMVYLFGVWILLVAMAFALSHGLVRALQDGDGEGG